MPKIIIQAGHEGRKTGATGAPGEQAFTVDVSNKLSEYLKGFGFEVKRVSADPTDSQISGDWDLFLSVHYDADVYGDSGGFVDYPEPSTDGATKQSQAIAKAIESVYFSQTGVKNRPKRSNKNTRYYYMWSRLSLKTPCVIIECGVGARKPKDYEPLHTNRQLVAQAIGNGILKAFNIEGEPTMPGDEYETIVGKSAQRDKLVAEFDYQIGTAKDDELLTAVKKTIDLARKSGIDEGKLREVIIIRDALGLPSSVNDSDGLIAAIKGLIQQGNSGGDQNSSSTADLPKTYKLKDGSSWSRNGLQISTTGEVVANYDEKK